MPRFHVRDTFAINDKSHFVLAGFFIKGEVRAGMKTQLPLGANVLMTETIHHLEHLRRPDGNALCLGLRCRSAEEIALWQGFGIKDRTVDIAAVPVSP